MKINQVLKNNTAPNVMDLRSLADQGQPQNLVLGALHRRGLRRIFSVEAQYSARHLTFTDVGAGTTDPINGTMILDLSQELALLEPDVLFGLGLRRRRTAQQQRRRR